MDHFVDRPISTGNAMDHFVDRPISTGPSDITSMKTAQKTRTSAWDLPLPSNAFYGSSDTSFFSSSLPVLPHEKFNFKDPGSGIQPIKNASLGSNQLNDNVNSKISADDLNIQGVGIMLPDDEEELLAGIADDFDLSRLPSQLEEVEECDLFGNVGGLELDSDPTESVKVGMTKTTMSGGHMVNEINQYSLLNGVGTIPGECPYVGGSERNTDPIDSVTMCMAKTTISEGHVDNGINHHPLQNGGSTISGEHPYGEHPSRTLFVRNINSNVEDSELLALFEQYGDIRSLYTTCKNRGFVIIHYYDIRSARTAMHALQNKPLRRRKLDIHFSIPKENPSEKDVNQGTLVIFNLDPSVSNDELEKIFGAYGEVKEIRETPHKRHHRFIEFYDVRAAEAALRSLNKSDIAGKRIKLEPSRPGGARRNLMQQLSHDLEQDDSRIYRHDGGSPMTNSPPGTWLQFGSPGDNGALHVSKSPTGLAMSPIGSNNLQGLASVLPTMMPKSVKIAPIGKDQNRVNLSEQVFSSGNIGHVGGFQHSHSLPDHIGGIIPSSIGALSSLSPSSSNASGFGTLSGPQFLWGNPTPCKERPQSSWQSRNMGVSSMSNSQSQGQNILYSSPRGTFLGSSHNNSMHHVGSAPPGIPLERHYGYESPDTSFMNHVGFGNVGVSRNSGGLMMNMNPQSTLNSGFLVSGNIPDNTSPNLRMISSQRLGTLLGNAPFPGLVSRGAEGLVDRNRNRRVEGHGNQVDNKKQYQLDLEKILKGEDTRTTLMIKNIPNKYTAKMLLAAIDENHKGTYDFIYLPIDFKNKCNVGYAFINMVLPSHIISFYEAFDGKKWEKFNSEKVASLAYARIQGKVALVAHFQNSSLMNEDKRCRPIIFDPDGSEVDNQEAFQLTGLSAHTRLQNGINSAGGVTAESQQLNNSSQSSEQINPPGSGL